MAEPSNAPDLYRLLELAVDEEHFYIGLFHKARVFYAGIILAILTYSTSTLIDASTWKDFLPAGFSISLCYLFATFAPVSCTRSYNRFLHAIARRAKLEARLGLMGGSKKAPIPKWCQDEPLVPGAISSDFVGVRPSNKRRVVSWLPLLAKSLRPPSRNRTEERRCIPTCNCDFLIEKHAFKSSFDFVKDRLYLGDNQITEDLFWLFRVACLLYFFVLAVLLVLSFAP